jgi:hypothetical protein
MRTLIAVSKLFVSRSKLAAAIVAGTALVSFGSAANALTYGTLTYSTSGSPTQMKLGDTIGSTYDQLQILGVTNGTINSDPDTILLNTLIFTAGVNATVPAAYQNFSFTEDVTIGTGSGSLTVPFNLSINYSDTLTVIAGTTISIAVGTSLWNIVVDGLTIGPNGGGPMTGYLMAQVSDPRATPLPAALVLFGTGLGAMGLFCRRRKLKTSAVPAA